VCWEIHLESIIDQDCARTWGVVDVAVIHLKVVILEICNPEPVNVEVVNLEGVDQKACAMVSQIVFFG
jgi:hypothetical protein